VHRRKRRHCILASQLFWPWLDGHYQPEERRLRDTTTVRGTATHDVQAPRHTNGLGAEGSGGATAGATLPGVNGGAQFARPQFNSFMALGYR
jgi:hypothetical protein